MRDEATRWVAPGRGSSLALLREAIGQAAGPGEGRIRTSLLLTGSLLDRRDYDRIREVLAQPELHQVAA